MEISFHSKFIIIKKEDDLDKFDDEEDIFQMKTFEYNFAWTWDVQNETCAICRSSLMELSPNVSVSLLRMWPIFILYLGLEW